MLLSANSRSDLYIPSLNSKGPLCSALLTIRTLNTAGVEKGSSTHWFTGQLQLMVMVKLVENDHIIIEDEQLSTDYYYAFKEQKQGMVNFLLFIFMK